MLGHGRIGVIGTLLLAAACSSNFNEERAGSVQSKLTIASLEINQALGVQYQNARKFVAGKSTAIIAYLDAEVAVNAETHKVVVKRGDTVVTTLTPDASAAPTKRLVFQCPTREQCGSWAEGAYTFEATIDGVTSSATATFSARRAMRILAVPIKVSYGAGGGVTKVVELTDDRWKKSVNFVKATFPIAPDDVNWTIRDTLDLTAVDANTDAGRYKIWQALTNLNPSSCGANKADPGCYDVISGFVKSRMGETPGAPANLQGYTYSLPGVVSVADDDDLDATVAHEISHPFGIGDEYQGGQFNCDVNPVPAAYVGKDFNDSNKATWSCAGSTETAPPQELGTGVLVTAATSHPFDTTGRGFLPDVAGYMGSGAPQKDYWVQPRVYDRLFDQLVPVVKANAPPLAKVVGFEAGVSKSASDPSGFVADVQPLYTFEVPSPGSPTTNSEWYARTVDAANTVLSSMNSTLTFAPHFEPPTAVSEAAMQGSLVLPPSATKIQIMHDATVVKEIPVSPNAPVVSTITGIAAGQSLTGKTAASWTMTDADNDTLTANVEYSFDNQKTWEIVDDDVTASQVMVDWDTLPGGNAGESFLRVVVTDGVNTTVATSAGFTVAKRAPEVYIDTPAATVKVGERVTLEGEANDVTGDLDNAQLVWTSSLDGRIGAGSTVFTTKLKAGTHVVTLTGTNSVGVTGTAAVTITVVPGAATGGGGGSGGCAVQGAGGRSAALLGTFLTALGLAAARRRRRAP